jgi:hypothetical protein
VVTEENFAGEDKSFQRRTVYKILLAAGTDVRTTDQVVDVTIEGGQVVAGPFKILAVLPRRGAKGMNHISLKLERIK